MTVGTYERNGFLINVDEQPPIQVWHIRDTQTALKFILAFYGNDKPAIGGTRWISGTSYEDARRTVVDLAVAMAYKARAMDLPLDGVKSFVYAGGKTRETLLRLGDAIEMFGGRWLASVDMGTNNDDMKVIAEQTRHVSTKDPSPNTAHGIALTILRYAAWKEIPASRLSIYVTGVYGSVGFHVAKMLADFHVQVIGTDIVTNELKAAALENAGVSLIHHLSDFPRADIYVPCAVGGVLNSETIPLLAEAGYQAVIGSANCQLATTEDGERLHHAGILYAPDSVVNGAGLVDVARQFGIITYEQAEERILAIGETIIDLMEMSLPDNTDKSTTVLAAKRFAPRVTV